VIPAWATFGPCFWVPLAKFLRKPLIVQYWEWPMFRIVGDSGLVPGEHSTVRRPWDHNVNSRVATAQRWYGWGFEDVPKRRTWT
jgi:hypothetical protein